MRGGCIDPSSCLTTHFFDLAIGYKAKRWEFSVTTNNLFGTSEFTNLTFRYCPAKDFIIPLHHC